MTPPPMSGLALNALEKVDGGRSTVFSVLLLECSKNAIGATHTHTHTQREREREVVERNENPGRGGMAHDQQARDDVVPPFLH